MKLDLDSMITEANYVNIYNNLSILDKEGWCHLNTVKKLIPCNIYSAFYYEDNIGLFEDMNGYNLIKYYEINAFAECKYEIAANSYEKLAWYSDYNDKLEYIKYKEKLKHDVIFEIAKRYPEKTIQALKKVLKN